MRRLWEVYSGFLASLHEDAPSSIQGKIISAIARRGVVSKKELREIAGDSQVTLRQVLNKLRNNALIYYRRYCKRCYVVSMPWLFFAKGVLGDGWRGWLEHVAPSISRVELGEIEGWMMLSDEEDLERLSVEKRKLAVRLGRVRRFVEARLDTLNHMASLASVVREVLPDKCSRPPSELLRGFTGMRKGTSASPPGRFSGIVAGLLETWFLECYVIPVLEYTPFLLKLLAGMAYAYATGYDLRMYTAELRLHARHWKEIACLGDGCYELYERLAEETFRRLITLLEHLRKLQREGVASLATVMDEFTREWIDEGITGQKLYNTRSIVLTFLHETIREFYT